MPETKDSSVRERVALLPTRGGTSYLKLHNRYHKLIKYHQPSEKILI